MRARPVVTDDVLVVPVAYGANVVGVDRAGALLWTSKCGKPYFPQWGSPCVYGRTAIVPRTDGFVHAVDIVSGQRQWSIFLGRNSEAGKVFSAMEPLPGEDAYPEWSSQESNPINAPVTVQDGHAYALSSEGYAYCLRLPV